MDRVMFFSDPWASWMTARRRDIAWYLRVATQNGLYWSSRKVFAVFWHQVWSHWDQFGYLLFLVTLAVHIRIADWLFLFTNCLFAASALLKCCFGIAKINHVVATKVIVLSLVLSSLSTCIHCLIDWHHSCLMTGDTKTFEVQVLQLSGGKMTFNPCASKSLNSFMCLGLRSS